MGKRFFAHMILALTLALAVCLTAACEEAGGADAGGEYVPQRYWMQGANDKLEQEDGNAEYEALYDRGTLNRLEVELEDGSGEEYEVLYDTAGEIIYAEYENAGSQISYDGSVWRDESGNVTNGPDLSFAKPYFTNYKPEPALYPHNTMGLAGLPLRELNPGLNTWLHVVPVDLTEEGVRRYPMLAGNMFYLGWCDVTVQDGKVTVDYLIPQGNITPEEQCVAWFTDVSGITQDFVDRPQSEYRFGEPADIATALQGQDTALLFIRNRVSFEIPLGRTIAIPVRFYVSNELYQEMKQEMLELYQRMGSV